MRVAPATPWAEAVLHVLAHVDPGPIAPSCHCPAWIDAAAKRLGPATERPLGEDARLLAQVAGTHEAFARAQAVAWLFASEAEVRAAAGRDLARLEDADVRSPRALRLAQESGAGAEILRAAAELEMPLLARLPHLDAGDAIHESVTTALAIASRAAPRLAAHEVALTRPLGLRGRVFGRSILVGAPGFAGADADHVAWQAAHEATVSEIVHGGVASSHDDVERAAIARMRARARRAELGEIHARWLGRLDLSRLGPIPDVADGA